jgi:hypothetical protein
MRKPYMTEKIRPNFNRLLRNPGLRRFRRVKKQFPIRNTISAKTAAKMVTGRFIKGSMVEGSIAAGLLSAARTPQEAH